jgi:hypothetical protein
MSFHVKCGRCGDMAEADADEERPILPSDWGEISVLMGDLTTAWGSEYDSTHLCRQCLVELADFLRGVQLATLRTVTREPQR